MTTLVDLVTNSSRAELERVLRDAAPTADELARALIAAVRVPAVDTVDLLLYHGADPSRVPLHGPFSAIQSAVENERIELLERLVAAGGEVNQTDMSGMTLLHLAVDVEADGARQLGVAPQAKTTAALLSLGADPALRDDTGRTPLDIAVECGHVPAIRLLRPDKPSPVTGDTEIDWPALMRAATAGPVELIEAAGPWLSDPEVVENVVARLVAQFPLAARTAVVLLLTLPDDRRQAALLGLSRAPRPAIRQAALSMFAPARLEIPGTIELPIDAECAADWLARAIGDEDEAVRTTAAATAFATNLGFTVESQLVRLVETTANRELRWIALLALGSARDEDSLATLRRVLTGDDDGHAAAAVRALGQRSDGHSDLVGALTDLRNEVRRAALFALTCVTADLTGDQERAIEIITSDEVRDALASYRARAAGAD